MPRADDPEPRESPTAERPAVSEPDDEGATSPPAKTPEPRFRVRAAMRDVHTVLYLVHSMGTGGKFIDREAEIAQTEKDGVVVVNRIVDGSGDLRQSGGPALRVGLEDPRDAGLAIGVTNLENQALCASATNRRVWGDGLHHVLDARSGMPVRDVVATWTVADDAATADALATALFFTAGSRLAQRLPEHRLEADRGRVAGDHHRAFDRAHVPSLRHASPSTPPAATLGVNYGWHPC